MKPKPFIAHNWPVFYEDNHLLALYKPAGLLIQGDQTGEPCLLDLAKAWIKERYQKPGKVFLAMVHRLDRPVAGVVVFCRTSKAAARVSAGIRGGRMQKIYWAVVEGNPAETSGRLIHHVTRPPGLSTRVHDEPSEGSIEARLSYRVLAGAENHTLVEVVLETGRHHQIRAQLSHVGHPILGDLRYGASAPLSCRQIALLARSLTLEHPTLKRPFHFECPIPRGWPWPESFKPHSSVPWNWSELCHSEVDVHPKI